MVGGHPYDGLHVGHVLAIARSEAGLDLSAEDSRLAEECSTAMTRAEASVLAAHQDWERASQAEMEKLKSVRIPSEAESRYRVTRVAALLRLAKPARTLVDVDLASFNADKRTDIVHAINCYQACLLYLDEWLDDARRRSELFAEWVDRMFSSPHQTLAHLARDRTRSASESVPAAKRLAAVIEDAVSAAAAEPQAVQDKLREFRNMTAPVVGRVDAHLAAATQEPAAALRIASVARGASFEDTIAWSERLIADAEQQLTRVKELVADEQQKWAKTQEKLRRQSWVARTAELALLILLVLGVLLDQASGLVFGASWFPGRSQPWYVAAVISLVLAWLIDQRVDPWIRRWYVRRSHKTLRRAADDRRRLDAQIRFSFTQVSLAATLSRFKGSALD